jgi:hypothetical protein
LEAGVLRQLFFYSSHHFWGTMADILASDRFFSQMLTPCSRPRGFQTRLHRHIAKGKLEGWLAVHIHYELMVEKRKQDIAIPIFHGESKDSSR